MWESYDALRIAGVSLHSINISNKGPGVDVYVFADEQRWQCIEVRCIERRNHMPYLVVILLSALSVIIL
jgi:hypothetical protein